jgi:hypothetical protein
MNNHESIWDELITLREMAKRISVENAALKAKVAAMEIRLRCLDPICGDPEHTALFGDTLYR